MRLVIDTNILVSYVCWPNSALRNVLRGMLYRHDILRSMETYAELTEVLLRSKFDPYLSMEKRELFLAEYAGISHHVLITERVTACRDPRDNKFLELALCGNAQIIISGDKDLLALDPFQSIRILQPAALVT